jgi:hypothetical protein
MLKTAQMLLAIVMLTINIAHADTSKTITFANQKEENFDLENWLKETRYRTETQDATCYNKVPYVENVCRDVTHYRQECSTIPGHQECRTVYDPVCRTEDHYQNECHMERGEQQCRVVVHYRQECSTSPGGQQCRTEPGRVECSVVNGENRCVKIPPREVCENRPGNQVCRQVPYEERECTEGPAHQVCQQVNHPQQVCQNVPRQQCDYIPDRNVCNQIPYTVNECKDETLYRDVPYACKKDVQVPYDVTLKTHEANVDVLFDAKSETAAAEFTVALDTQGALSLTGNELDGNEALVFAKKDVKTTSAGDVNTIKGTYKVSLINKADLFDVSEKGISNATLNKRSLTFVVNGKFDQKNSSLALKIVKKGEVKLDKVLKPSQFTAKFDGSVTKVEVDLDVAGAPKLGGLFDKTYNFGLKLKVDYSALGDLVLPKLGELSVQTNVNLEAR